MAGGQLAPQPIEQIKVNEVNTCSYIRQRQWTSRGDYIFCILFLKVWYNTKTKCRSPTPASSRKSWYGPRRNLEWGWMEEQTKNKHPTIKNVDPTCTYPDYGTGACTVAGAGKSVGSWYRYIGTNTCNIFVIRVCQRLRNKGCMKFDAIFIMWHRAS